MKQTANRMKNNDKCHLFNSSNQHPTQPDLLHLLSCYDKQHVLVLELEHIFLLCKLGNWFILFHLLHKRPHGHTSGSLIFSMVIRRRDVWLESVCSQLLMSWRHGWRGTISSQYLERGPTNTQTHTHMLQISLNEEETKRQKYKAKPISIIWL